VNSSASFLVGLVAGTALTAAVASGPVALAAWHQEKPSAIGASQHKSRVVLENERVRVKEVIFPAGVTRTGQHTHDLPHVGVILTAGALMFTEGGKSETVKFAAGDVGFRPAKATHDVGNPGTGDMRVIEVEIK
jgi:quercetin dioxygenase-like cupin family protein